jgi:aryl-alcohol dehydrogenase-like predicted oxidoreductase
MSAAEVALRFVLNEPRVHSAIQATSNMDHLESNIALSDGKGLPDEICAKVRDCYRKAVAEVG